MSRSDCFLYFAFYGCTSQPKRGSCPVFAAEHELNKEAFVKPAVKAVVNYRASALSVSIGIGFDQKSDAKTGQDRCCLSQFLIGWFNGAMFTDNQLSQP